MSARVDQWAGAGLGTHTAAPLQKAVGWVGTDPRVSQDGSMAGVGLVTHTGAPLQKGSMR